MRAKIGVLCVVVGIVGFYGAVMVSADEPIFVRWLVADDPGDETILEIAIGIRRRCRGE